jgi:multidrug efflux pump subunit AcrA (membrane-fusion protein)
VLAPYIVRRNTDPSSGLIPPEPFVQKRHIFVLSLSTLGIAGAAFLLTAPKALSSTSAPAPDKAKVILQEMKQTDDTRRLLVPTKVEARVASLVTAEAEGFVTRIVKSLGSRVKAGDVILYVENKDPAFTYAKVPVRSPVTGVVSQMMPSLMSRVSRGDKLFVVMDPKELKLTAEIPGSELSLISPGTPGVFKQNLDDKEGSPIRVSGISPLVDPRTGTAAAELEFVIPKASPKKAGSKEPASAVPALPSIGMVGHALFEMSRGKVLLIPESALGYADGKPTVKVLDGKGLVVRKNIELGEQKESLLVVKSGLEAGEKLIVRSNRTVKDGEAVDVDSSTKN